METVSLPVGLDPVAPPVYHPRATQYTPDELALQNAYDNSLTIFHGKRYIEVGDLVIVYMSRDNLVPIIIKPGSEMHNKYGRYRHDDMIGCRFGSKFRSPSATQSSSAGYIHLLSPTPQLWTQSLPHRTQILYLPDIAFIMAELGVRPGSRVVEAGTGSGSMSHALAMGVGASVKVKGAECGEERILGGGKVFSYEYHATRYDKALKEFADHGLQDTVALAHRNVCKDGFGEEAREVDSVFLDLPAPWDAIPHAAKILRTDISTRICCFSPCMEQVTRTVTALDAEGFSDIAMYEVLSRAHEIALPRPVLKTVSTLSLKNKIHAEKKEVRRRYQMMNAREKNKKGKVGLGGQVEGGEAEGTGLGDFEEEAELEDENGVEEMMDGTGHKRTRADGEDAEDSRNGHPAKKRRRSEEDGSDKLGAAEPIIPDWLNVPSSTTDVAPTNSTPSPAHVAPASKVRPMTKAERQMQKPLAVPFGAPPRASRQNGSSGKAEPGLDDESDDDEADAQAEEDYTLPSNTNIFKPVAEMRGHTSYLTFATMVPKRVKEEMEAWEEEKERRRRGRAVAGLVGGEASGTQRTGLTGTQGTQGSVATTAGDTTFESGGLGAALRSMTEEELANLEA